MKVPIEADDKESAGIEPDEVFESDSASVADQDVLDPEVEERAHIEAAIRAGEETAEKELASNVGKIRSERDELQKKLSSVSDEIGAAKKEAADATDRLVRLQADWDNYRRRTAAERLAEKERAAEKLVCNLLPVLDDLERAIEHAGSAEGDTQMQQFVEGVSAVHTKMLSVLDKEGVEPIDPVGEPFEPLAHQAVGRVEDKDVFDETVAQVYQKGYRMGEKVIRAAMVTVAYGGPKRPAPQNEDSGAAGADQVAQDVSDDSAEKK